MKKINDTLLLLPATNLLSGSPDLYFANSLVIHLCDSIPLLHDRPFINHYFIARTF